MDYISDFVINQDNVLVRYRGENSAVTIPEGVVRVGSFAFRSCTTLQSVIFPESVTTISDFAFQNCKNLESIFIGNCVSYIAPNAFEKNLPIRKCTLITTSADEKLCKMVTASLGMDALVFSFLSDTMETNAIIRKMMTSRVTNKRFRVKYFTDLIENQETTAAIRLLSLIKTMEPEEIDDYIALSTEKQTVEITNELIQYRQTRYPQEVVEAMREIAWEKAMGIREMTLTDYKKSFSIKKQDGVYVITGYKGENTTVVIPGNIRGIPVRIAPEAFIMNGRVQTVYIEDGITEISGTAFGVSGLQSISFSDSVTSIEKGAFHGCKQLQSIVIPDSVKSIGESAFAGCLDLQSITIGSGVTSIAFEAFCTCPNLRSIVIADGNPIYHSQNNCLIETAKKTLVLGCQNSVIPNDGSVTAIYSKAFENCSNLTDIVIPDTIRSIGENAFTSCTGLSHITIPESIIAIAPETFSGCTNLQSITLPKGLRSIGNRAFLGCKNLRDIQIPDGVTMIHGAAFANCARLERFIIPDSVEYLGNLAFEHCSNLKSVQISKKMQTIGLHAFFECDALEHIVLPDTIKAIRRGAFQFCSNLKSVTIPDSVTSIDERVFDYCRKLTIYASVGSVAEAYAIKNNIPFQAI